VPAPVSWKKAKLNEQAATAAAAPPDRVIDAWKGVNGRALLDATSAVVIRDDGGTLSLLTLPLREAGGGRRLLAFSESDRPSGRRRRRWCWPSIRRPGPFPRTCSALRRFLRPMAGGSTRSSTSRSWTRPASRSRTPSGNWELWSPGPSTADAHVHPEGKTGSPWRNCRRVGGRRLHRPDDVEHQPSMSGSRAPVPGRRPSSGCRAFQDLEVLERVVPGHGAGEIDVEPQQVRGTPVSGWTASTAAPAPSEDDPIPTKASSPTAPPASRKGGAWTATACPSVPDHDRARRVEERRPLHAFRASITSMPVAPPRGGRLSLSLAFSTRTGAGHLVGASCCFVRAAWADSSACNQHAHGGSGCPARRSSGSGPFSCPRRADADAHDGRAGRRPHHEVLPPALKPPSPRGRLGLPALCDVW